MDIKDLKQTLDRAAALFRAAGSKTQAKDVEAIAALLEETGDATLDDFADRTSRALSGPSIDDAVDMLRRAETDKAVFETAIGRLSQRDVEKTKVFEVASTYTGARKTAWSSKKQALDAIRSKFDERVFLESKSRLNDRVTPW